MKISIITVCYNSSKTILDTIRSVNSQSYENIEHVFVDGLSSDNTLELIKLNSKKPNLIISEKDYGIYDAINKGISIAKGDVIGLLHSDDILSSPDIILYLIEKIKSENLDAVYADLQYVHKENCDKIVRYWRSKEFNYKLLFKGWMPPHPTLYLKKAVYDQIGEYNISYKISADYDFMLRMFKSNNFNFGYMPKVLVKMKVGGESNKSLKNILIKLKEDYKVIKRNNTGNFLTLLRKNTSKFKQFI